MSKLIGHLLGVDVQVTARMITRLESICLQPGVDTKLTAEIITKSREKTRNLGLDPADTTIKELYHALIAKAESDDKGLRLNLGIGPATPPQKAVEIIANKANALLKKDTAVRMQPTAVKQLLCAVPPKKTLRALKFRSIESVLKHQDPLLIYAIANKLEDKSWHSQVQARMKRLHSKDILEGPVEVMTLSRELTDKLAHIDFDNLVMSVPETGMVLIMSSIPLLTPGSVLLTMCLVLQAAQKLAIESLPHRAKALNVGYENLLPEIASGYIKPFDTVHGLTPTWDAVYRLLAEHSKERMPDFEFLLNDLDWVSIESKLASLHPKLDFWLDSHFLGYDHDIKPVSMHVVDVVASLVLKRDFGNQIISHLQASLWNELQVRYLKQESLEQLVLDQLSFNQSLVL